MRDLEFEKRCGYDDSINYKAVIKEYNTLVEQGRQDEAKSLLRVHGGIILLCGKCDYQKERQK